MSLKETRQILANELGLSRELVKEIVREQVQKYIAELGGLDGLVRHAAKEELREIGRGERKQWASLESAVDSAVRQTLLPVLRQLIGDSLPKDLKS